MLGPGAGRDERRGERSGCCCTSLAAAPNMSEKSMASGGSSRTPTAVATDMTSSVNAARRESDDLKCDHPCRTLVERARSARSTSGRSGTALQKGIGEVVVVDSGEGAKSVKWLSV